MDTPSYLSAASSLSTSLLGAATSSGSTMSSSTPLLEAASTSSILDTPPDSARSLTHVSNSYFCENARKRWELENDIKMIPESDLIFKYNYKVPYDPANPKPWEDDPEHFQFVKMSAISLLKMVMHTRSGGEKDKMGVLLGKYENRTIIISDAVPLPIEDCEETYCPQRHCIEYMAKYTVYATMVKRFEGVVGWYHSHSGYGCYLSGIDVISQRMNQNKIDPNVAIVIDPVQTISSGKVCLGAFRTYPINFRPTKKINPINSDIPPHKMKEYKYNLDQYYSLEVSYYKSELDVKMLNALYNEFWIDTLSNSHFFSNPDRSLNEISRVTSQLKEINSNIAKAAASKSHVESEEKKTKKQLQEVTQNCNEALFPLVNELMSQLMKNTLWNKISIPP